LDNLKIVEGVANGNWILMCKFNNKKNGQDFVFALYKNINFLYESDVVIIDRDII
jgi:hypothetical protein